MLSTIPSSDSIKKEILKVGTTGDYKPVTYLNPETGKYEGLEIELIQLFGKDKNYDIDFIETSWPTLLNDTLSNLFQIAIGGITKTEKRMDLALMSEGYLEAGKTFLMRKEDVNKYNSIEKVNKTEVRVMINPGGTNEEFARANLSNATIIVHPINQEIPQKISEGEADIMVTEVMEGLIYARDIHNLAVPLYKEPFTHKEIGALMNKENTQIYNEFNEWIKIKKEDGTIENLKKKYIPQFDSGSTRSFNKFNFMMSIILIFLILIS